MKLAVSNIAWDASDEDAVALELAAENVKYVEIAPTKVFTRPLETEASERAAYTEFWAAHGIQIIAFQSMLFGRPDLQLFGPQESRAELVKTLVGFIELAAQLEVGRLVFGSPKNRIVPAGMAPSEAQAIAVETFGEIAAAATANGTVFCIEPNPTDYACNFVTTAAEGLRLVTDVNHEGFALHLDAAGMALSGDPIGSSIGNAGARLKHFHASAPFLGPLEDSIVNHAEAGLALQAIGYDGFVSIEMRPSAELAAAVHARRAVQLAAQHYKG